jgi:hypothetical protein
MTLRDDRTGTTLAIIAFVCVLAMYAIFRMLAIAVANYNPNSWETVVLLGGWDSLIFPAILGLAVLLRRSQQGLVTLLTAAVVLAVLSLGILYYDLHPYFAPPVGNARVLNSYGPLVEFVLPLLQWPLMGLIVAITWWFSRRRLPDSP